MFSDNGGFIGVTSTTSSLGRGVGVWTTNAQANLRRNRSWPLSGDPFYSYTSLLLLMDGSNGSTAFTDNSIYALTLTPSDNAQISTAQSKFGGASALFDGNGDYIAVNSNVAFDLSEDFTIECWVRTAGNSANQGIVVRRVLDYIGNGTWGLQINNGVANFSSLQSGGVGTDFGTVSLNTWTHIAVSRSESSIRMFLNGNLNATVTDATDFTNAQNVFIGAWGRTGAGSVPTLGWFNGYIDDLRITKGVARYIANFTPPTQANLTYGGYNDPYFVSTSLLLHMDGTNNSTTFTDSSLNALTVTANGNAMITTAQSKFGGASGAFDGVGDYLVVGDSPVFDYGSGDFTIEFWGYFASASEVYVYSKRATSASYTPIACGVKPSGGILYAIFAGSTTGSTWNINGTFSVGTIAISQSTWTHLAYVRSGSTIKVYVNGVADLTVSGVSGSLMSNAANVSIGASDLTASNSVNGYIDDLRITKGIARYTADFTPPDAPFPDA